MEVSNKNWLVVDLPLWKIWKSIVQFASSLQPPEGGIPLGKPEPGRNGSRSRSASRSPGAQGPTKFCQVGNPKVMVVWNMSYDFPYIGNVIIPTD